MGVIPSDMGVILSAAKDLYTASDKTLHFVQSDMSVVLSDIGIILSVAKDL
jgi:hypothetical protein